jgi:hypothetical protein
VHGALGSQAFEHVVRGALEPQIVIGDLQRGEVPECFGRHGVKRTVTIRVGQLS